MQMAPRFWLGREDARVARVSSHFSPGAIISLMPDEIHSIELSSRKTMTLMINCTILPWDLKKIPIRNYLFPTCICTLDTIDRFVRRKILKNNIRSFDNLSHL